MRPGIDVVTTPIADVAEDVLGDGAMSDAGGADVPGSADAAGPGDVIASGDIGPDLAVMPDATSVDTGRAGECCLGRECGPAPDCLGVSCGECGADTPACNDGICQAVCDPVACSELSYCDDCFVTECEENCFSTCVPCYDFACDEDTQICEGTVGSFMGTFMNRETDGDPCTTDSGAVGVCNEGVCI